MGKVTNTILIILVYVTRHNTITNRNMVYGYLAVANSVETRDHTNYNNLVANDKCGREHASKMSDESGATSGVENLVGGVVVPRVSADEPSSDLLYVEKLSAVGPVVSANLDRPSNNFIMSLLVDAEKTHKRAPKTNERTKKTEFPKVGRNVRVRGVPSFVAGSGTLCHQNRT